MTIIAIDGPSGSGKSTISRLLAERLNLPYLDTGAMYRAVALVAMRRKIELVDADALTSLAATVKVQLIDERIEGRLHPRVVLEGMDATLEVRTPDVTQAASAIAVHPGVRERLVRRQRTWVTERGGAVVEGRDIGTVVFPEAGLKVFLTADQAERVRRRAADPGAPGFESLGAHALTEELAERDQRDSSRDASPLTIAPGALVIDTSDQEIEDIVIGILAELRKRAGGELPMGTASRSI